MEKKSKEIPLVVANEHGTGQTEPLWETFAGCGVRAISTYVVEVEVVLERHTTEGESPVHVLVMAK